jgi:hypothetical protein
MCVHILDWTVDKKQFQLGVEKHLENSTAIFFCCRRLLYICIIKLNFLKDAGCQTSVLRLHNVFL